MAYDVVVLGLGAMGSAACHHLAKRGARVLGLEQFTLGHALGSSHGRTRLIRQAYFEEDRYVPLMKRAYPLWDAVGEETGEPVFHRNGLLIVAPAGGGNSLSGVRAAAEKHAIPLEFLNEAELAREYPQFRPGPGAQGIFEPGAGYLDVERAVIAHARLAQKHGAELHFEEPVRNWRIEGDGVVVTTDRASYSAARLVVAGGAWSNRLLSALHLPLHIWRVPQFWFAAQNQPRGPRPMPCFAFDHAEAFIYGFPDLGDGLKIADYHPPKEIVTHPGRVDRKIRSSDLERLQRCIRAGLPGVASEPRDASVCLYTMTPDQHFILDRHPRYPQITFAAGFSGHGFKFAPVIGEILADLSERGETSHEIAFLRWRNERARI